MDNTLIERLAREAGQHEVAADHRIPANEHGSFVASADWVRRFAALVAEECARLADGRAAGYKNERHEFRQALDEAETIAWFIRAKFRGPK